MGKLNSGILGGVNGKVGTIVGSKWKNKEYIRHKGPANRKNNSPRQLEQQAKFGVAIDFVRFMSDLFRITYKNYTQQMTARNNALAGTVKKAITGVYPDFSIDYSMVQISRGNLRKPLEASATVQAGIITWKWFFDNIIDRTNARDKAVLVIYSPYHQYCHYEAFGPARQTGTALLNASFFTGQTVHTWLAFITEDATKLSDSVYTGQLVVS